jgi:hypothetical protein
MHQSRPTAFVLLIQLKSNCTHQLVIMLEAFKPYLGWLSKFMYVKTVQTDSGIPTDVNQQCYCYYTSQMHEIVWVWVHSLIFPRASISSVG